jgi:hypothetical protein
MAVRFILAIHCRALIPSPIIIGLDDFIKGTVARVAITPRIVAWIVGTRDPDAVTGFSELVCRCIEDQTVGQDIPRVRVVLVTVVEIMSGDDRPSEPFGERLGDEPASGGIPMYIIVRGIPRMTQSCAKHHDLGEICFVRYASTQIACSG